MTPWTEALQAPLSSTISRSLLKFMSIDSAMLSNHLFLCHPLLLLLSVFPIIRVFSSESALRIRWPKYWSFSFSISPSNEYSGLISLQSKGLSRYYSRINQIYCCYYLLIHVWFFMTPWTPWKPARLLCPWNFLGKNTGVGYHFLLQIKCISLTKHGCKLLNSVNSFIRFVLGSAYFEYQSCCLK